MSWDMLLLVLEQVCIQLYWKLLCHLPRSIATGVVLGIARAAGETAPLIFTALFSYYYITGFGDLFYEMGSLAVLIYNIALEPYDAQNKLAWAASFILVLSILSVNIFSRILAAFTEKTKRV